MALKVLVIDDSALMRKHLRSILESAGYEVSIARNGEEGLEAVQAFKPDVVTLDINMPVMDGITCLSLIMESHPCPVLMVSSLTEKGALATFEALELGAVDYVAKPGGTVSLNIQEIHDELLAKVATAAKVRMRKSMSLTSRLRQQRESAPVVDIAAKPLFRRSKTPSPRRVTKGAGDTDGVVLVGVSTGGPGTVETIISQLPSNFPWPLVIAQHMPARFTQVFAERLNKICALTISEVDGLTNIEKGNIYIAKGDADVKLVKRAGKIKVNSVPSDKHYLWHPSVSRLVDSAGQIFDPTSIICVQLTGMGHDGAAEMAALHEKGVRTIAESEDSAIVYGMPKVLVDKGGADCVLPAHKVAAKLIDWLM